MRTRRNPKFLRKMKILSGALGIMLVGVGAFAATDWVVGLISGSSGEAQSAAVVDKYD